MPDSSLKLIRLSEIPMLHDKIYKAKYKGGLKILCKNENYLIFEDKPFSFFDVVSFHRASNRGLVFDIKIIRKSPMPSRVGQSELYFQYLLNTQISFVNFL